MARRSGFFHLKDRPQEEISLFQAVDLASGIFWFPSAEAREFSIARYAQAGCGGRQTQGSGDIANEQPEYSE